MYCLDLSGLLGSKVFLADCDGIACRGGILVGSCKCALNYFTYFCCPGNRVSEPAALVHGRNLEATRRSMKLTPHTLRSTWTPKVGKIMAFVAIIGDLVLLFYILLGFRYNPQGL